MYCYARNTPLTFLKSYNLNAQRLYIKEKNNIRFSMFVESYDKKDVHEYVWGGQKGCSFDAYFDKYHSDQKLVIFEQDKVRLRKLIDILSEKGLRYFYDYIFWDNLMEPYKFDYLKLKNLGFEISVDTIRKMAGMRKVCILNGNCQIGMLKKYLLANPVFRARYMLLDFPEIHNVPKSGIDPDEMIQAADLLLTQPIKASNRFTPKLSVDYMREHKREGARLVTFSLLNFTGYFPQYTHDSRHISLGVPLVSYGDKNIDNLLEDGKESEEIVQIISKEDFYSPRFLDTWFARQLQTFRDRDGACDVKMYDWLQVNYDKEILFHSFNHPRNTVLKELSIRLLRYIGILDASLEDEADIKRKSNMHLQEQPVYPSVYKYLHLPVRKYFTSPNLMATSWRFGFKDYVEFYVNSLEKQFLSEKKLSKQAKVFIWGSCVSRELFNYSDTMEITGYLLQNPMHTLFSAPVSIKEEEISATSNFTKRMFELETTKKSKQYFVEHPAEWLLIDTCDCRNDFYILKANQKARVCQSITADKTIKESVLADEYERVSVFTITDDEWRNYVDMFCKFILNYYSQERIILNEFRFAEYYLKDGVLERFPYADFYIKLGRITKKVEEMLKQRMPKMHIVPAEVDTIGDYYSHIGCSAMHYIDEICIRQVEKLENIISKTQSIVR